MLFLPPSLGSEVPGSEVPFTLYDVTNAQRLAGTQGDDTTPLVAGDTVRVTDLPDDPIMLMLGTGDWTTISEPLQMPYFTAHTFITTATDTVESYSGDIPDNFASTNSLTTAKALSLGNSVTSIGSYAFYNCAGFTGSLTIPDSVTSIGNSVFYNCTGFTGSLTIPDSVTSIGSFAFLYCAGFTGSLTIPDSVTSIGSGAFSYCTGFTGDLNIPDSVTTIGNYAFDSCANLTTVNCYVTKTIFNQSDVLVGTGVTTLHALASDGTWTAGADTIGGKALTVIKDLV